MHRIGGVVVNLTAGPIHRFTDGNVIVGNDLLQEQITNLLHREGLGFGVVSLTEQPLAIEVRSGLLVMVINKRLPINLRGQGENEHIVLTNEIVGKVTSGINDQTDFHGSSGFRPDTHRTGASGKTTAAYK